LLEEEQARIKKEEEKKRLQEEEQKRLQEEVQKQLQLQEEEQARIKNEEEQKRLQDEEQKRIEQEEEQKRLMEEQKRIEKVKEQERIQEEIQKRIVQEKEQKRKKEEQKARIEKEEGQKRLQEEEQKRVEDEKKLKQIKKSGEGELPPVQGNSNFKDKKPKFPWKKVFFGATVLAVTLYLLNTLVTTKQNKTFSNFTETIDSLNLEMIAVKGGTFDMGCTDEQGSDCNKDEKPKHTVTVSDFYIGKCPITVAQFRKFVTATNYRTEAERDGGGHIWTGSKWEIKNDANWRNPYFTQTENDPVVLVSWNDAQKYVEWLNQVSSKQYRLPTEAEWEFAARGVKSKVYKYSGSNTLSNVAWYYEKKGGKTHPVGRKSPNKLGIFDMSGNVWEWCRDWYNRVYYLNSSKKNPTGPESGTRRVVRGGSWNNNAEYCRVSYRDSYHPGGRSNSIGFRLACSL